MKISLKWLEDFITLPKDLTLEQLAYDLTMRTVEVEDAIDLSKKYENIVVGHIEKVEAHPDADRLRVCQVKVGEKTEQIVCGGKNVYEGEDVIVCLPGSTVLWHGEGEPVLIEPSKLRGVESFGMIAGASEVGLLDLFPPKDDHEIVDLTDKHFESGMPLSKALGLDGAILEIDNKSLTNRPDLWGHYGIARELAAIYDLELKPLPKLELPKEKTIPVEIIATDLSSRYSALEIKNIEVAESPAWLKRRLLEADVRPINNVVDLTNYLMLTTGQPTHGFDYNLIDGTIYVRRAKNNEDLTVLTGETLTLTENDLVIADDKRALALAGVMGAKGESINNETNHVLLEVASFNALSVRKTSKRHNIRTDASARFEKDIDTARVDETLGFGAYLFKELFPEAEFVGFSEHVVDETKQSEIEVDLETLALRLGERLEEEQIIRLLSRLGFDASVDGKILKVVSPVWRSTGDIERFEDIVEEIARMKGYENFEYIAPTVQLNRAITQHTLDLDRRTREYLAFQGGMQEIFTYPWISDHAIEASGLQMPTLSLEAPPAPDKSHIRRNLIPGLLECILTNETNFESFGVFELAKVFRETEEKSLAFGIISPDPKEAFFKLKGILEGLSRAVMCEPISFVKSERPPYADQHAYLNILCNGEIIGSFGVMSIKTKKLMGLKHATGAIGELDFEKLVPLRARTNRFTHLPVFPEVEKDLSVVFSNDVRWEQIRSIVEPMVKKLHFVDEYHSEAFGAEKKSITLRVILGNDQKTMEASDIEKKMQAIYNRLHKELGGEIRE
ncbi:phenylalanine--tRNA ligase subunit beta [Guggenheimella bovis]